MANKGKVKRRLLDELQAESSSNHKKARSSLQDGASTNQQTHHQDEQTSKNLIVSKFATKRNSKLVNKS